MIDPEILIKKTIERIKSGTLTDFSPLIALFQFERKPMTLDGHFMFLPFFSLERPKYITLRCGRQVSKSYTLSETLILTTGMIESFNSIYIAPRYDQLKRFNTQVLAPMLKTPAIAQNLVDRSGSASIEMKAFLNGNTLMLEHSFSSPDRVRGASNCAAMALDESVTFDTEILVFHLTVDETGVYYISDRPEIVPISEVKQGDIVLSFTSDGCIYSPVVRDASYHGRRAIFKVTTQSGRTLRCTADHRLHTNRGSMRLSEVIEYPCNSGNGAPAGAEGRNQRLCFKRDCRNTIRRRAHRASGKTCKARIIRTYGARYKAKSLSRVQSVSVIRARYTSHIRDEEQRLRAWLSSTNMDRGYRDIFVACADGVPGGGLQQDGYERPSSANYPSGGAGALVRGRRVALQERKRRPNIHKRLYRGGGCPAVRLVAGHMEGPSQGTTGNALEHRKACAHITDPSSGIYTTVESGARVAPRVYEIQAVSARTDMSCVRQGVSQAGAQPELLRELPKGILEDPRARVLRGAQGFAEGPAQSIRRAVPRNAPGGDSCEIETEIRGAVSRRTSGPKSEGSRLSEEKGGVLPPKGSRALPETEVGPRRVGKVSGGPQGIQRGCEGGPGAVRSVEGTPAFGEPAKTGTKEGSTATSGFSYDRIVSIEYVGESDVYDIEVVGTHNYVLANGMCSYNCQDINPDFLPVFESTTDASRYGIIQASGTPKLPIPCWRYNSPSRLSVIGLLNAPAASGILLI